MERKNNGIKNSYPKKMEILFKSLTSTNKLNPSIKGNDHLCSENEKGFHYKQGKSFIEMESKRLRIRIEIIYGLG